MLQLPVMEGSLAGLLRVPPSLQSKVGQVEHVSRDACWTALWCWVSHLSLQKGKEIELHWEKEALPAVLLHAGCCLLSCRGPSSTTFPANSQQSVSIFIARKLLLEPNRLGPCPLRHRQKDQRPWRASVRFPIPSRRQQVIVAA